MKTNLKRKITIPTVTNDDSDDDDDDDDEDMYDEMDPNAIAALNDPTTLQDDEESEDSDEEEQSQVKEPDEEEESEEESSKEEQDPNPTTANKQTVPENAQMTSSGRISKPRQVLNLYQSHLQAEAHQEVPYSLRPCHCRHHVPTQYQDRKPQQSTSLLIYPDLQSKEWIKEVWRSEIHQLNE
jgi:hypothetical protein